ncbi:MAG: hypothetical protein JEZ11_04035 [Desulfobacterales bacterium]|nr:hypothetical protein [Desulfobacterales bacterium]
MDLFHFYLTEKSVNRVLRLLDDNEFWQMFLKDCDQDGTDYNVFMNGAQKRASVTGVFGIMVTKPRSQAMNRAQEIAYGVYPYCVPYIAQNILDWEYDRDPVTGRKVMTLLKLREENGDILVWTRDEWEVWAMKEGSTIKKSFGSNPIGEIPFVWLPNMNDVTNTYLGQSDILEICRIGASIVRNISCGEEIIEYAGFPMMRVPMKADSGEGTEETETGPEAIHQFDPSLGEGGKPDWMKTEILQPIEAILNWIDRKVDELFRTAHLSGVHGQRKSNNEVSSGLALRYEFQQLNAVLSKKADNLDEADRRIAYFFHRWQNLEVGLDDIDIHRDRNFSTEDLSIELENLIKAMGHVKSLTFLKRAHEALAKKTLPNTSIQDKISINNEINANVTDADLPAKEDLRQKTSSDSK